MGRAFEVRKAAMAKTSAAKAKVYSKFGKEIYMEAKNGVPDLDMNVGLKRIVDRAKKAQVPADIIARAIEKAKGGSNDDYHLVRYEGFGPAGSTVIVECLTDNDNRSVSEVRNAFTKSKGKMGVSGSVLHGYDHVGILGFNYENEEEIFEILLEGDIALQEIEVEEGSMSVIVEPFDLHKAREVLEKAIEGIDFDVYELTYLPHDFVTLSSDEDIAMYNRLTSLLEDCEDVQDVYHNIEV
jgi:YebC/PmpR family DNA-binding regulatory protein